MKKRICLLLAAVLALSFVAVPGAMADTFASSKTTLKDSSGAKKSNIDLAIAALDGTDVYYNDYFSFNDIVGPRTTDEGYKVAINGRGVKVVGGGVSQVAATLYLALKQLDDIDYVDKKVYGSKFSENYVSSGSDAIVTDYKNDVDFSFYNYFGDFTISMWRDKNYVYCTLTNYYSGGGSSSSAGSSSIELDGSSALINNVELAANSISGYTLQHNDVFSFNDVVGPRTTAYGFKKAVNGRGVQVVGGGVAIVASGLWLAVEDMDDIDIVEKRTYGSNYNQHYVSSSSDAIMTDYNADYDFSFRYTGYDELTIYTYISGDTLICELSES
ncbi:MAG: VanW family protein [Christensenellales bacterium]|jgi:vancomycin resistance protein YoaR